MRVTSKDQKPVRAQPHSLATPSAAQPDALAEAAACGLPPQSVPLQARSSNSGTSVKRSDNISQSSYPHGDISSDKPGQCGAAWARTSSTSAAVQQSHQEQPLAPASLAIGQTTSAFGQKRGETAGTPTGSTANTKNAETAAAMACSSSASLANKRSGASRRAATSSAATANQDHSLSSTASGQQDRAANPSATHPAPSRVSTRASGRQTRQSDYRAVKDSSPAQQQLNQQCINSSANQLHPRQSSSDVEANVGTPTSSSGCKRAQMMIGTHQGAGEAQSLNHSALNAGDSSLLRPVKQSCSEQQVSSSMRTTRSKAKAKHQDVRNAANRQAATGATIQSANRQAQAIEENNQISNGQSDSQKTSRPVKVTTDGDDQVMNTGKDYVDTSVVKVDESEPILNISAMDGNLEIAANMSQMDAKAEKRMDNDLSHQLLNVAEESKLHSPRSSLNSTLIAGVAGAESKPVNQSFRINDSTDSLLENPLTTVIKQFQNLRTNAQLTGKNKPTIQQFLEKFEKEMQYLEDQYQAQQQAREEQMRLFEQHYGGKKPVDQLQTMHTKLPSGKPASGGNSSSHHQWQHPYNLGSNDQVVATAGQYSNRIGQNQLHGDTLMVQDTASLGPMPHNEQSNNISFISAVHGPNNQSVLGGANSDITHNAEVYESFSFTQNSMLQFYPRQVRKILTRRKTTNSANTIMSELKDLKAPKHKLKTKKTMSKMQSLAICQMNMMQILLQKISRRSKVIRKQEKLVNDNLKRKRIYLERERFDLMSVLRKSLEVTEEREQHQQQLQQEAAAHAANVFESQLPSCMSIAQKNKTHQMRTTATGMSDLNSNCLSTSGTKYGTDQPNTQSIKGSTAAPVYGEDTSMDGFASRKQTRLQSGAEHCLSVAADSISYKAMHTIMEGSVKAQQATPEPPSKKANTVPSTIGVAGDEEAHHGQSHQIGHIQKHNDLAFQAQKSRVTGSNAENQRDEQVRDQQEEQRLLRVESDQIFAPNCLQTPPKLNSQSRQIIASRINNSIALQQQMVANDGADSLFGYDQHDSHHNQQNDSEVRQSENLHAEVEPAATMIRQQPARKMQSTQGKQRKRKSTNLLGNKEAVDNTNLSSISHVGQAQSRLNLDMESAVGDNGSYAIADLQQPSHIKTRHLPDGNFAITIKKSKDPSASGATQLQQQQQPQQHSQQMGNGGQSNRNKRRQGMAGGSKSHPNLELNQRHQQKDFGIKQVSMPDSGMEEEDQVCNALVEQQKHDNQRKLSPLRNIGQDQQNATNLNVQQAMSMQFESNIDANNFFSGMQHHSLNMVDHHMQPDHFMMSHAPDANPDVYHHHGAPEQVSAQMQNVSGNSHHFQPLVPQASINDLAMHRSQSHLLPSSHQYHLMGVDPTIPLVEAGHHHHFDQFGHVHFVDAEEGQVSGGNAGGEQDHHRNPHGSKPKNHDVLNLNFFDESAQELSSIDHSAAAVDQYGYNSQSGPNPYEQAKRQYLKKSMMAAQQASQQQGRNGPGVSSDEEVQPQHVYVDRVNQFVSPMVVGLQQLSAEQHTPQAKVDGHHHQHPGAGNQQSAVVDDVDNTPSHFMSGVEVASVHQAGLGRGTGMVAAQQRRIAQQQLSVNRICGTNDPFNLSATSAHNGHHLGRGGPGQNTFGNTPAGLLSNGQPCIADAHRQHLSVSGWNLVDVDEVVDNAGHRQHEEDDHRQQSSHHIYHQGGLPEHHHHHHHPYM